MRCEQIGKSGLGGTAGSASFVLGTTQKMHRDERASHVLQTRGAERPGAARGTGSERKVPKYFRWSDIKLLLVESIKRWSHHNDSRLGASLAFYTLFSLTPLLLVAVSVAGLVASKEAAEGQVIRQIHDLVGPQGAAGVRVLLAGAHNSPHGVIATAVGLLTLLFGASGVLLELRDALNTIWEVPPAQTAGLRSLIQMGKERLFSFALVLAVGFLLLVSLLVNAWIAAAGKFVAGILPAPEIVLHAANEVFSFIIITALFAAIYKVLPDTELEWRDVVFGSAVTSLLFTVGKLLIGLYLGKASFTSTYGAAASVVILIAWVYYSSQIFFLGAEFTKIFAVRFGSKPSPPAPLPMHFHG